MIPANLTLQTLPKVYLILLIIVHSVLYEYFQPKPQTIYNKKSIHRFYRSVIFKIFLIIRSQFIFHRNRQVSV